MSALERFRAGEEIQNEEIGRAITRVPQEAMERLLAYSWPGNVRELENIVERAVIPSNGPEPRIAPEMIPATTAAAVSHPPIPAPTPASGESPADETGSLGEVQRRHILAILERTQWRIEAPEGAARLLDLSPSTLRSRMQKLGIRRRESLT